MSKQKDIIRRKEIHLPDSVIERLSMAATKKKWSLKKYMEQVLTDKVKTTKTILVLGEKEYELK